MKPIGLSLNLEADYGLRKLSNYLKDPAMSLAGVENVRREVFLGQ